MLVSSVPPGEGKCYACFCLVLGECPVVGTGKRLAVLRSAESFSIALRTSQINEHLTVYCAPKEDFITNLHAY
jgi:hypothetical protein